MVQEKDELLKKRVLYIGSAVPMETAEGLDGVQKPLLERYPMDDDSKVEGILSFLSIVPSGITLQYVSDPARILFFPISSLTLCAAVRCVTTCNESTGEKTAKFVSLSSAAAGGHNCKRPAIFTTITRRTEGRKVLECHGFICSSSKDALELVQVTSYADRMSKGKVNGTLSPSAGLSSSMQHADVGNHSPRGMDTTVNTIRSSASLSGMSALASPPVAGPEGDHPVRLVAGHTLPASTGGGHHATNGELSALHQQHKVAPEFYEAPPRHGYFYKTADTQIKTYAVERVMEGEAERIRAFSTHAGSASQTMPRPHAHQATPTEGGARRPVYVGGGTLSPPPHHHSLSHPPVSGHMTLPHHPHHHHGPPPAGRPLIPVRAVPPPHHPGGVIRPRFFSPPPPLLRPRPVMVSQPPPHLAMGRMGGAGGGGGGAGGDPYVFLPPPPHFIDAPYVVRRRPPRRHGSDSSSDSSTGSSSPPGSPREMNGRSPRSAGVNGDGGAGAGGDGGSSDVSSRPRTPPTDYERGPRVSRKDQFDRSQQRLLHVNGGGGLPPPPPGYMYGTMPGGGGGGPGGPGGPHMVSPYDLYVYPQPRFPYAPVGYPPYMMERARSVPPPAHRGGKSPDRKKNRKVKKDKKKSGKRMYGVPSDISTDSVGGYTSEVGPGGEYPRMPRDFRRFENQFKHERAFSKSLAEEGYPRTENGGNAYSLNDHMVQRAAQDPDFAF